jgi:conjugal transfer mating pair stabilization protein TraG
VASANIGAKGGRNQAWTDSDIGIASEDRSRIFGSLSQMSDSRNWSSTRDGFVRSVNTSSNSSISTTASGMTASLTEAQSYSREARRAEELAHRLESQVSFVQGNSAAGSLNLSQAYREWGLAEIESNRDFYGTARFDDVSFQLSPEAKRCRQSSSRAMPSNSVRGSKIASHSRPDRPYLVRQSLARGRFAAEFRQVAGVPVQCPA